MSTEHPSDTQVIDYLKALVIDAVQRASSGHIGGVFSAMDITYYLFTSCLRYDPDDPDWLLRDRFILSAGHASMLIYSLHYAIGYLQKKDLQDFRQLGARTPGHPEHQFPGIECTTGQLGQGASMAVGFAIANLYHRQIFAKENLFDQQIVSLLGDGCMQEGVTLASASYAGHLALSNLTWIYDRNRRQISGKISRVVSDNYEQLFQAFGWQVISINGHDHTEIKQALQHIHAPRTRPLLIISNSTMSKGAHSVEGDATYHGAPFPPAEAKKSKEKLSVPAGAEFYFPDPARKVFQRNFTQLRNYVQQRREILANLKTQQTYTFHYNYKVATVPPMQWQADKLATREAFGEILTHYAPYIPLMGGSADLEASTMTTAFTAQVGEFTRTQRQGRALAFGVREFPMSAISNGIAMHGGLVPFDATFLCFADYARPAIRSGALQKARVIHEYTHDSFLLGEDGATHQPVEQLMSLRALPNFYVMRPADGLETEVLFKVALALNAPSAFCLTRQRLSTFPRTKAHRDLISKGGYTLRAGKDVLLLATGSEVSLALQTASLLTEHGVEAQVVSLPCWELFAQQDLSYRQQVLPDKQKKRVSIEAGIAMGWERYIGEQGTSISIEEYGVSGKMHDLAAHFGFTPEKVAARVRTYLRG